jgi:hypothetical protein
MPPWPGKRRLPIVTACLNVAGDPDLALTEVELSHAEYADGVHCEQVEDRLIALGYSEPFVHFDQQPVFEFLVPIVRRYLAAAAGTARPSHVPPTQERQCRGSLK